MVREAGAIDNATYRSVNKVDVLTASAALRRLRDAGLLAQQGRGSATWYRSTEKLTGQSTGQPEVREAVSSKLDPLSSKAESLSSKPDPLSSKSAEVRNALLNEVSGSLAVRIGEIGLRHPPEQVRALIVDLCRMRPWKAEELAILLKRKPETIRQDYLRPLLAQKQIAMTIPDKPNSPQQAYRSVVQA